jgi:hypothetical protein
MEYSNVQKLRYGIRHWKMKKNKHGTEGQKKITAVAVRKNY